MLRSYTTHKIGNVAALEEKLKFNLANKLKESSSIDKKGFQVGSRQNIRFGMIGISKRTALDPPNEP